MAKALNRRNFLLASGVAATATALPVRASEQASDIRHWDTVVDVLVAGSGAAGSSAAIEARKTGNDVLVLEKLLKLGGSSAMSGGVIYMGGGTPLQKACGFDDSPEAMYQYIVSAGRQHPHLDKVQRYCEQSVEHFNWCVEMGIPYKNSFTKEKGLPGTDDSLYYSGNELAYPIRDIVKPVPRGHVPGVPGWTGGRTVMAALISSAKKLGVKYLTEVSCERLIKEADGRVSGLRVEINGQVKNIRARKGVVLACGGFIHNREMVKRYAPELYNCSVPWGNIGDLGMGIQMGIGAGAAALRKDQGFSIMPLYQPAQVLKGISVNRSAQRFVAEESYHAVLGDEIAYNQGGQAWLISDSESQYGYDDYRVKVVAEAGSISELEQKLGFPVGGLAHTLNYYNQHAKTGTDPLFHKDKAYLKVLDKPPYFAYDLGVETAFFPAHTFGGLHTSVQGEVMDAWGEAIPGLYAAGRTSSGLPTSPYIASGISVGDCTFFGRLAGQTVGAEV
jgi:3-oxo-5alpha-steroid 4-dehydrogenase